MQIPVRLLSSLFLVSLAALIAVGCGGSDGGDEGVAASDGPLSYLPTGTWLVATAKVDSKTIDEAVKTLDRLPIWALAEGFLPASDGPGLRKELLEQVAKQAPKGSKVTAQRLEAAFGDGGGVAITSNDFSRFADDDDSKTGAEDVPVALWIDVDDADAADEVLEDLLEKPSKGSEHEGVEYRSGTAQNDQVAWTQIGDHVLLAPGTKQLELLIDAHEGDENIAGDEDARRVLEAGVGDAIIGAAIQTTPLLDALPKALEESDTMNPEQAKQLSELLSSDAVGDFVPSWVSGSTTIDSTGLRMRGAWSNPRDIAEPEVGSRELAERMPADAGFVSAGVDDGTTLGRVQDAWAKAANTYDIKLEDLTKECEPQYATFCDLGVEAAKVVLEDDALAKAVADAGPVSYATVQDIGQVAADAAITAMAPNAGAAAPKPAAAPTARSLEIAVAGANEPLDYKLPAEFTAAAKAAGLVLTVDEDQLGVNIKVTPGSPLAVLLARELTPEVTRSLLASGVNPRLLLGPGITIKAELVDDIAVAGLPTAAPSKVAPALRGDVETLGEYEAYRDTVDAAKPPKDVGAYGYVDLSRIVESVLNGIGAQNPTVKRAIPTVKNNLADVPGILMWSAREEVDGEDVGVFELVMPITE
ncbi:MAG: hypothetical protein JWM90_1077 [Thermoleophilia bacterium]|nr:hypothetical protein [Thermoleophilia bacterium]